MFQLQERLPSLSQWLFKMEGKGEAFVLNKQRFGDVNLIAGLQLIDSQ